VRTDLGVISTEPMPGAELDLGLLAGLVALMAIGPGLLSIDAATGLDAPAPHPDGRSVLASAWNRW